MPGWLRNAVGALILLATATGTVVLHRALERHEAEQISRVAEAESWAARSQLVRAIETRLRSYRELARYWSTWGRLPRDQWATDAGIEVGHFPGVRMIVWYDPERDVRFYVTPDNFVPDYRPSDQEWREASALLGSAPDGDEAMIGPGPGPDGHSHYRVYVRGATPGSMVAALIDAHDSLEHQLQDESAGYAVAVHWNDVELYRRDEPARDIPSSWIRSGVIETSMGARWRVTHAPGEVLADSLHTPLGTAILAGGLAITALLGLLLLANARTVERATAAESAEAQLAVLNRRLEAQVAERTADLETLQASVAHDLRNALNTVALDLEQLLATRSEPVQPDAPTGRLARSVRRMTAIVDRLVGLSRASHATFARGRVDMTALALEVVQEAAEGHQPAPECRVDALPPAEADPVLVRVLLLNLVDNALKYTRGLASPRIEISAESRGTEVVYTVADNGAGFDAGEAERLFQPFTRLEGNGNATNGLGLGLTIARRVVTRHGGRIWAESEPGQGARFRFTLAPGPPGDDRRGAG